MNRSKEKGFLNLVERVRACRKCPRMEGSARVLGLGCGPLDAQVVFIGEAPGRLGADSTELPFHGDRAGHNFESLIEQVGISRYQSFVTNAVLCNPKDAAGNNATPTLTEVANCAPHLEEQLALIDPRVVVTLGATSLRACQQVAEHSLELRTAVRTANPWAGRTLIPLYHPGQRAMVHRSFANQLADYQFVAERLRRPRRPASRGRRTADSEKLAEIAHRMISSRASGLSYFGLHKLYFLSEVSQLEEVSERLTNAYVIRQKNGPYCADLHLERLRNMVPGLVIERDKGGVRLRASPQLTLTNTSRLSTQEKNVVDAVISKYGLMSDADLKRVAYLSRPMREVLKRERTEGINLFNSAILPYTPAGRSA